jgi:hypothetical protein
MKMKEYGLLWPFLKSNWLCTNTKLFVWERPVASYPNGLSVKTLKLKGGMNAHKVHGT